MACVVKSALILSSLLMSANALAETLQLPTPADASDQAVADFSQLPQKGSLKSDVLARYGEPQSMSPAVGEPPISRWSYPDMVVFFEYDHVINAVIPGKPRPIFNREELRRGDATQ